MRHAPSPPKWNCIIAHPQGTGTHSSAQEPTPIVTRDTKEENRFKRDFSESITSDSRLLLRDPRDLHVRWEFNLGALSLGGLNNFLLRMADYDAHIARKAFNLLGVWPWDRQGDCDVYIHAIKTPAQTLVSKTDPPSFSGDASTAVTQLVPGAKDAANILPNYESISTNTCAGNEVILSGVCLLTPRERGQIFSLQAALKRDLEVLEADNTKWPDQMKLSSLERLALSGAARRALVALVLNDAENLWLPDDPRGEVVDNDGTTIRSYCRIQSEKSRPSKTDQSCLSSLLCSLVMLIGALTTAFLLTVPVSNFFKTLDQYRLHGNEHLDHELYDPKLTLRPRPVYHRMCETLDDVVMTKKPGTPLSSAQQLITNPMVGSLDMYSPYEFYGLDPNFSSNFVYQNMSSFQMRTLPVFAVGPGVDEANRFNGLLLTPENSARVWRLVGLRNQQWIVWSPESCRRHFLTHVNLAENYAKMIDSGHVRLSSIVGNQLPFLDYHRPPEFRLWYNGESRRVELSKETDGILTSDDFGRMTNGFAARITTSGDAIYSAYRFTTRAEELSFVLETFYDRIARWLFLGWVVLILSWGVYINKSCLLSFLGWSTNYNKTVNNIIKLKHEIQVLRTRPGRPQETRTLGPWQLEWMKARGIIVKTTWLS